MTKPAIITPDARQAMFARILRTGDVATAAEKFGITYDQAKNQIGIHRHDFDMMAKAMRKEGVRVRYHFARGPLKGQGGPRKAVKPPPIKLRNCLKCRESFDSEDTVYWLCRTHRRPSGLSRNFETSNSGGRASGAPR